MWGTAQENGGSGSRDVTHRQRVGGIPRGAGGETMNRQSRGVPGKGKGLPKGGSQERKPLLGKPNGGSPRPFFFRMCVFTPHCNWRHILSPLVAYPTAHHEPRRASNVISKSRDDKARPGLCGLPFSIHQVIHQSCYVVHCDSHDGRHQPSFLHMAQSTSSTVGSVSRDLSLGSPEPPACAACKMGSTASCNSFCFSSHSRFSADGLSSSHERAPSMASVAVFEFATESFDFKLSSRKVFRKEYTYPSRELRASTLAAYAESDSRFASSSATICSISSSLSRPFSARMVMSCFLPELFSIAETVKIPFASTLNVTSIWGTPRGIGGMPLRSNLPRMLLSFVKRRSPS
mmetsp:Transcript_1093/g.1679  ORF Transcript_1093/g.1679 Transcript_1093/m.1679 type:complete len:347 (+) Transcript_1093:58-1098(+)